MILTLRGEIFEGILRDIREVQASFAEPHREGHKAQISALGVGHTVERPESAAYDDGHFGGFLDHI